MAFVNTKAFRPCRSGYGNLSFNPSFSLSLVSPLAAFNLATVVSFFRAMAQRLSPGTTTWMPPLLFLVAGFGFGLLVVVLATGLEALVRGLVTDVLGLLGALTGAGS